MHATTRRLIIAAVIALLLSAGTLQWMGEPPRTAWADGPSSGPAGVPEVPYNRLFEIQLGLLRTGVHRGTINKDAYVVTPLFLIATAKDSHDPIVKRERDGREVTVEFITLSEEYRQKVVEEVARRTKAKISTTQVGLYPIRQLEATVLNVDLRDEVEPARLPRVSAVGDQITLQDRQRLTFVCPDATTAKALVDRVRSGGARFAIRLGVTGTYIRSLEVQVTGRDIRLSKAFGDLKGHYTLTQISQLVDRVCTELNIVVKQDPGMERAVSPSELRRLVRGLVRRGFNRITATVEGRSLRDVPEAVLAGLSPDVIEREIRTSEAAFSSLIDRATDLLVEDVRLDRRRHDIRSLEHYLSEAARKRSGEGRGSFSLMGWFELGGGGGSTLDEKLRQKIVKQASDAGARQLDEATRRQLQQAMTDVVNRRSHESYAWNGKRYVAKKLSLYRADIQRIGHAVRLLYVHRQRAYGKQSIHLDRHSGQHVAQPAPLDALVELRRSLKALRKELTEERTARKAAVATERKRAETALTVAIADERKRAEKAVAAERTRAETALTVAVADERKRAEKAVAAERRRSEAALSVAVADERRFATEVNRSLNSRINGVAAATRNALDYFYDKVFWYSMQHVQLGRNSWQFRALMEHKLPRGKELGGGFKGKTDRIE